MLGLFILLSTALAPPDHESTPPAISPAAFRRWFDSAAEGRLVIPDDVKARASRYRYVFVGGLQIGMMQGYLAQNAKELRAKGVPPEAIHILNPSSHKTVVENAEAVRSELKAIAELGPEKLVLIAHSRGACDTLAFALRNPTFVTDRVHAMFLVQGPFGGTGVADYVAGEGPPMDGRMPFGHRVLGKAIGRLEAQLLGQSKHEVITSLSHRASDRFWDEILEDHCEAISVVDPKTFYVTSRTGPSKHPLLAADHGVVSEGLLRTQRRPGFPGGPDAARARDGPGGPRRRAYGPDSSVPCRPPQETAAMGTGRRDPHGRRQRPRAARREA